MKKLSEEILNSIAPSIKEKIIKIQDEKTIEEIRLRVNKPLILNSNNKDYFLNQSKMILDKEEINSYIVTKEDIERTFQLMCKYSIHSFMDDIIAQKKF